MFLHNLQNYGAHLIIEKAVELSEKSRIDVGGKNFDVYRLIEKVVSEILGQISNMIAKV